MKSHESDKIYKSQKKYFSATAYGLVSLWLTRHSSCSHHQTSLVLIKTMMLPMPTRSGQRTDAASPNSCWHHWQNTLSICTSVKHGKIDIQIIWFDRLFFCQCWHHVANVNSLLCTNVTKTGLLHNPYTNHHQLWRMFPVSHHGTPFPKFHQNSRYFSLLL